MSKTSRKIREGNKFTELTKSIFQRNTYEKEQRMLRLVKLQRWDKGLREEANVVSTAAHTDWCSLSIYANSR